MEHYLLFLNCKTRNYYQVGLYYIAASGETGGTGIKLGSKRSSFKRCCILLWHPPCYHFLVFALSLMTSFLNFCTEFSSFESDSMYVCYSSSSFSSCSFTNSFCLLTVVCLLSSNIFLPSIQELSFKVLSSLLRVIVNSASKFELFLRTDHSLPL